MNQTIVLSAHAKVNLVLDVIERLMDGYHRMDMLNRSVDLCDELYIRRSSSPTHTLTTDSMLLQLPHNLVLKAAQSVELFLGEDLPPMDFTLHKKIPAMAGLGGGSSDAAAAIIGINELLDLKLTGEEMAQIGIAVGADVPFCLVGGAARVTGIGEGIRPVTDACRYTMVILMPDRGRSTKAAFEELAYYDPVHPDVGLAERCLTAGDLNGLAGCLGNVLYNPETDLRTRDLMEQLKRDGARGACMSGSGSAVFGLFDDAERAANCVKKNHCDRLSAYVCKPVPQGVGIQ